MRGVAAYAAIVIAVAGCGEEGAKPGTLTVQERWTRPPGFIEGHVAFASVRDSDGHEVARGDTRPAAREDGPTLSVRLAPGRYRVAGHVRSCSANCAAGLDAATHHCSVSVEIDGDTRVTFVRTPWAGCRAEVAQP